MGNYRRTINTPAFGMKIESSRSYSTKYGFGLNLEQELTRDLGAFARLGWNDGATETWAFTEIDRALSFGLSMKGAAWGRRADTLAIAYALNGLSGDHADFLRAGGNGFMVGDGRVNYALEHIVELYYSIKVLEPLSFSADIQEIFNPGYNRDRGPVTVAAARLHAEI
jgi:high affinity Mn2+ porin